MSPVAYLMEKKNYTKMIFVFDIRLKERDLVLNSSLAIC